MARKRPMLPGTILIGATAAYALLASPVSAQVSGLPAIPGFTVPQTVPPNPLYDTGGPVGVLERPRPEVEPQGLIADGLRFFPSVSETASYDTNIFAARSDPNSDYVFRTRPEITIDNGAERSMWTFNFDLYGEDDQYAIRDRLRNDNLGSSLGLGAELGPNLNGVAKTSYTYQHQDPSTLTTSTPNASLKFLPLVRTFSQNLGLDQTFGQLDLALTGGYTRQDYQNVNYSNGLTVNQTQLDGNTYQLGPKLGYAMSPALRPYVQGNYSRYSYDNHVFDANEYSVVVGTDFEPRQVLRGTVFAGYKGHDYDSVIIPSAGGFTYGINLTWFPTELLTVKAQGAQNFYDSTTTSATGVHATVNANSVSLEADYEALRNLILSGIVSYENDSYSSTTRTDDDYSAGIGVRYLMNPNWAVLAQFQYSTRNSTTSIFTYDRQLISVGLKLSF